MQLLNSKILSNDKNTRYSNKKAQDTQYLVLFVCCSFFVQQRCLTLTKKLSFPKQKTRFRNRAFFLFGKFAKEFLHFWRTWRSSFSSSPSCFPCWRSSYILYIMYREVYSEILSTVITSLMLQSKISQIFIILNVQFYFLYAM